MIFITILVIFLVTPAYGFSNFYPRFSSFNFLFLWYHVHNLQGIIMDDRITIIEGPTPIFEPVQDGWALGLNETRQFSVTALTRLRTFNGPALVERCHRQWRKNAPISLHYRDELGMESMAPILAARSVDTDDGHVLLLWLHVERDDMELEINSGDDDSADDDLDMPE